MARGGPKTHAKCVQRGQIGRWSIKTNLKQLRRGAPDQSSPLMRRRTSKVLAEIENGRGRDAAADSERAPSAQLTGHVALDVVAGAA